MNRTIGCIALILGCLFGFGILYFAITSTTTTGKIVMVQPNGWTTERDHRYSETNLNNAQANNYNAQANVNNAVATQTAGNANPPFFESFQMGAACGSLAVFAFFFFAAAVAVRLKFG